MSSDYKLHSKFRSTVCHFLHLASLLPVLRYEASKRTKTAKTIEILSELKGTYVMSMLIGDVIWNRQGQPALVTDKDPKKGTVHVVPSS